MMLIPGLASAALRLSGLVAIFLVAAFQAALATAQSDTDVASAPQVGPPVPPNLQRPSIETAFMPAELETVMSEALAEAPEIRSSRTLRRAADAELDAARWLRFPSISVNGNAFGVGGNGAGDTFASELQIDQPIWAGGRIGAGIRRARAAQDLANAEIRQVRYQVAETAINVYFQAVGALAQIRILDDSLEQHRALVDRIGRRVEGGVSPVSDLNLAQSRTAQVEQNLAFARAELGTAEARLSELLRQPDFAVEHVPPYRPIYHPPAEGLVDRAVACDPELEILAARIDVAEADAAVARAEIMPRLSAQYSRSEIFGDRVGLSLSAATQGGLSPLALASAARQRAEANRLDVLTRQRTLREDIASDLVANRSAQNRIATGIDAARLSEAVRESYFRQYVAGRRTWLDLMNAVREAASADEARAQAEITAIETSSRLALRACQVIGFAAPDLADDE
ncbi:hypothetical protein B5C34_10675 [Pacificimonas flava]|uniref:Outer membrane efflux protein n=2 Tax=Pacificimonas TaxID=1960290 RepID=A0A219B6I1_9SPHN|nr:MULTISPECIES: TolC family protein [Pacificimonas]MBZ6378866.1 TolC family protein [Pacificimonas aurantium]OWV33881.1 hypothetical protein B5C34_10675 [Pacificimonas flava]